MGNLPFYGSASPCRFAKQRNSTPRRFATRNATLGDTQGYADFPWLIMVYRLLMTIAATRPNSKSVAGSGTVKMVAVGSF
jgi:hypothetical protein